MGLNIKVVLAFLLLKKYKIRSLNQNPLGEDTK